MNSVEAKQLLTEELEMYQVQTFAELASLIGEIRAYEKIAASGIQYQIEIVVLWDDQPGGAIRVLGSIDDGGWRAFAPVTDDFLKRRTAEAV